MKNPQPFICVRAPQAWCMGQIWPHPCVSLWPWLLVKPSQKSWTVETETCGPQNWKYLLCGSLQKKLFRPESYLINKFIKIDSVLINILVLLSASFKLTFGCNSLPWLQGLLSGTDQAGSAVLPLLVHDTPGHLSETSESLVHRFSFYDILNFTFIINSHAFKIPD